MSTKITEEMYNNILNLIPAWNKLNVEIKKYYSRGFNFHEAFSEIIVGYRFNLELSTNNSADLIGPGNLKYQVKGATNVENDLSSFGPRSEFDVLFYCGLNNEKTKLFIWKIDAKHLDGLYVNKDETFQDQQKQGRRPRFSIYKKIILEKNLKIELVVDIIEK